MNTFFARRPLEGLQPGGGREGLMPRFRGLEGINIYGRVALQRVGCLKGVGGFFLSIAGYRGPTCASEGNRSLFQSGHIGSLFSPL